MVLYSFANQGNWIIAAGIYHAANLEQNPANARIVNFNHAQPIVRINEEPRITIVAHGGPGVIGQLNSQALINHLTQMGLAQGYTGIIELFSCHSGEWDETGGMVTKSIICDLFDYFNQATIVGAYGALIIDSGGTKHYVNPDYVGAAGNVQDFFSAGFINDLDQNIDPNANLYVQGENIRTLTIDFYNNLLDALYDMGLMLPAAKGMVTRHP